MEMKCPLCDFSGGLNATHSHMVEIHLDHVETFHDPENNKMEFRLACPFCDEVIIQPVNPRGRNPRFLEEFKSEIALVAYDQLLYHIVMEHAERVGIDLDELDSLEEEN